MVRLQGRHGSWEGLTGSVQDPEQFFQVILHDAVEQYLILISERGEERVFEDHRGLLRHRWTISTSS